MTADYDASVIDSGCKINSSVVSPRSGLSSHVLPIPGRIRERVAGWEAITVVFWIEDMDEGKEVALEGDVHLTRPDSFNQLRGLLARRVIARTGSGKSTT